MTVDESTGSVTLRAAFPNPQRQLLPGMFVHASLPQGVAEQGLLAARRESPREEQARQAVRGRARDLEFAWATFLARGMEQGAIPDGDPRLLTRAILGLYNSIWHWYRPSGEVALSRASDFYTARILAMVGVAPAEDELPRVAAA